MNKFMWVLVIIGLCAGQINGMWFIGLISSAIGGVGNYMSDTAKGSSIQPARPYQNPSREINLLPKTAEADDARR